MIREKVIRVPQAVGVPYGKDFAVQADYYFGCKRKCFRSPPVWTNIKFTEHTTIEKGEDILDAEHAILLAAVAAN